MSRVVVRWPGAPKVCEGKVGTALMAELCEPGGRARPQLALVNGGDEHRPLTVTDLIAEECRAFSDRLMTRAAALPPADASQAAVFAAQLLALVGS